LQRLVLSDNRSIVRDELRQVTEQLDSHLQRQQLCKLVNRLKQEFDSRILVASEQPRKERNLKEIKLERSQRYQQVLKEAAAKTSKYHSNKVASIEREKPINLALRQREVQTAMRNERRRNTSET